MGLKQKSKLYLLIASLNVVMMLIFVVLTGSSTPVSAAAGINPQLSFEGKIVNSNGTNLSNGTYNMQFKIYQDGNNMGSGSTLKWTENRLVGGAGGVTLVDGTFQVNLGSVTAFGSSVDWNQDTLWLSMQIGNTASCTITTSFLVDCSGDGEMSPYIRLTAVPYANNSAMLSGLVAGNFVQLAQGIQTDSSTTNSSIAVNKTGGTASILQLQKSSSDVFVINNSGLLTLQPAASLTSGQTHITQSLTNASSSGGTVSGYNQTITVSNTSSASNTNGINIALTDNASLSNTNKGVSISVNGSNTSQTNTGLYVSITGSNLLSYGVNSENSTDGGLGVRGANNAAGAVTKVYYGVSGGVTQTTAAAYTSYGVSGSASGGVGATTYGGYFSLNPLSNAVLGSALYATNSSVANKILQLQDNATDVLIVADGGLITIQPAAGLTNGQTNVSQTLTNASSTGGTVTGYNQTTTINNTVSSSTTRGINISISDNSGQTNTTTGLNVSLGGSNGNQNQTGVSTSVNRGIGVLGQSTGASISSMSCGAVTGTIAVGICGYTNLTSSNAYGGLFSATGDGGTALYATNSASTSNILKLQDNTTDVLTVADGGRIAVNSTYVAMSTPTGLSAAAPTSGGSLTFSTTYFYKVTAIDSAGGETAASTESSNTIAGSGSLRQIPLTWTAVTGASGYRIYRSTTTNTEVYLTSVLTNSYTDTGTVTIGTVSPPSTTTAVVSTNNSNSTLQISVGGNGTPTGQLYVGGRIPSSAVGTLKDLPNSANGIQIQGDYAYMGHGSGTNVPIINISNPLLPVQTGTFSVYGSVPKLAIQGKYVYSVSLKLEVFDISNPSSPTLKGSSTGSNVSYTDIEVQGNYAYTATFGNSLRVFDISNPLAPFPTASLVLNTSAGNNQNNLDIYGNYAYFVAPGTLYIVDISNPSAPSIVGSLAITSIRSVALQGKYAYIGTSATNKIQVVDISNPATPTLVGQLNPGFSGTVESLDIQGRYLYAVAGSSSNTVQVFDISNPYSPRSVGSFATDSSPAAIKIQGRYAYVVTGSNSMQVFDVGGTYTQQLEAGGIKTGTLSVNSSARISGDTSIQGGLQIGASVNASGNLGIAGGATIQGSTILSKGANLLSIPATPTITPQGTTGAQRWDYSITALNAYGGETTASTAGTTATGNATLSSTNFNRITWSTISGATSYNIYRTYVTGATSPTSTGLIGSTTLTTFDDTALSASGDSPTVNTTGQLTVLGSTLFKNTANTTAAFEIQTSSGTSVLKADTSTSTVTAANLTVTGTCTGCGGGATSLDDAYNQAAGTGNTITLTAAGDGVLIQDAATTVGGNLFAVQKNTGSVTYLGITTTGVNIQSNFTGSAVNALALDTSTAIPHLKIFGANGTDYADIYYDSSTSTAYYGASTGTAVLGSGTGAVSIAAGAGAGFTITGNATSSITTTAGDVSLDATGSGSLVNIGTGTNSKTIELGSNNTASVQNIYIGSNGNASAATSTILGTTFGTGSTTVKGGSGGINVQSAGTLSLTSGTTNSVTVDSSTTGNVIIGATNATNAKNVAIGNNNSGSTVDIDGGTGAAGIEIGNTAAAHGIQIGTNATGDNDIVIGGTNASSSLILEAGTGASAIQIGNSAAAHGIQIGTGAAIQTIVVGSTNSTSKLTLQGGVITTTNNNSGIVIGGGYSSSDTVTTPFTLDSDFDFAETASTCSASVNGGTLYYNTAANVIRGCVNGGWEDIVSTAALGLQLFGIVPDSGTNPGDLASVTGLQNGPCKVSVGANTTTVSWTGCTAYSGGRKVIVTAGTQGTTNSVAGNFQHLCLTAAGNQPTLSTTGSEVANLATVSMPTVTAPILCLADIRFNAGNNTITQIYDTRTYTTTDKISFTVATTAPALGHLIQYSATRGAGIPMATLNGNNLAGVVVASTGAVSTNTINVILATGGPASVKAITGTNAVNAYIFGSGTAGYASTVATKPAEATSTIYNLLGNARTPWTGATACAINTDACAGSIFTDIDKR